MPGVLQAEAMLQAFALPVLLDTGHIGQQSFLKHFEVALHKKVERRDTPFALQVTATISEARRGIYKGSGELHLDGALVASVRITMVSPHAMPAPRAGIEPIT
jgi:3-hydroxymyristoyl/3-hydroxydecanoyl-(acyl carrier protein) dehydratase